MLEFFGAFFIIIMGSFFHFLYDITKHNKVVGYFTAVNESTWEHIKLVIAPSILWFFVEYHFYADKPNLFLAQCVGLITMIIIIPLVFYAYMYFIKKDVLFFDIMSFVVAVIVGQYVFYLLINMNYNNLLLTHVGTIGLIIVFLKYITSTHVPKKNFLYKDPLTKKYGIKGHLK